MLDESIDKCFKLFDFNIYNERDEQDSGEEDGIKKDTQRFVIQMFGIDEEGKTYSAKVEEYQPFFYVKIGDGWSSDKKNQFMRHLKEKVGKYYENSIVDCKIIKKKKLYGFDGGKEYKFLLLKFANVPTFNKVKALWYKDGKNEDGENERKLIHGGYNFNDELLPLYEGHVPPLLRFFHIGEISPSGWVSVLNSKIIEITGYNKTTTCDYEFIVNYKSIIPLNNKETIVPYKIMSYDIEASSSHGDFPVPIKSYKKLAVNIVDYFYKHSCDTRDECIHALFKIIKTAFRYDNLDNVDIVYTKYQVKDLADLEARFNNWIQTKVRDYSSKDSNNEDLSIESFFEKLHADIEKEYDGEATDEQADINMIGENTFNPLKVNKIVSTYENKQSTIVDILLDHSLKRDSKVDELVISLKSNFPPVEGDKVTFIGSTFVKYGQPEPYLNHCIVLNTCDSLENVVPNSQIESYQTEQEVLLAWTQLVQRENPDIVIGYNIFSFDYEFMFRRAQECGCVEEFLLLSRNQGELCATTDYKTGKMNIDKSSITLASGTYDLSIIKMNGRLQIDMYNWFRRTENLVSYKLDYVGGYFIGDYVTNLAHNTQDGTTRVYTKNMTGLQAENYIHFEEINYSSDYYKEGAKFRVTSVNKVEKWFEIVGIENPKAKSVKWGLAKDDVTPKDIFRMTNEGSASRAVIAKYCIQDCNLVHHLFNKVDVITDLVEMARLCSVPMSFLVFRGQGIKLTSYVAKKCREMNTLIPTINKGDRNDAYEGAIVLEPKCGLYLDNPIGVGDFASLYPSSMLSENLCPSSKVWKKVYDLDGNLIKEIGETNEKGEFIYDNIPGYEYVDVPFDTYRYIIKSKTANGPTFEKVKSGHAVCRYAQPQIKNGKEQKAVMPSILQELLKARKDTRKLIPQQTDEFMKNVLDKRQLAYKVTANSLYGQLGAKTSTFYEPDVAAATTATGRLLLTYAKRVVEECYGNTNVETKNHGFVTTKAEYVYGDSVANYTPVYVKVNEQIDILTIEQLAEKYGNNNWVTCLELGKQEKEFCELENVETWTEQGWTKLHRVIRHQLASSKKMFRISTGNGIVDVTDDHSLLLEDATEVSPKDISIGTSLLHCCQKERVTTNKLNYKSIESKSFDSMIRAAEYINYLNSINYTKYYVYCATYMNTLAYIVTTNVEAVNINEMKTMKEIEYQGYVYDLTTENHHFAAGVGNLIVHNTDSVFFTFNLAEKDGTPIRGDKALELSIEIAQEACHMVSSFLKQPHDFEYEKTFMPLCLLSKKRYVGMLYEFDPKKGKRKEMGIVLKRRDNAPIVKDVYGGIIDIFMKEANIQSGMNFLDKSLQDLVNKRVPMEKLIITKSLNSYYKNPQQIAHKVLAERLAARDPGNKPSSGDRIPFVYIVNTKKDALQGDKIEIPSYIVENNIKIDYSFYITNQIMKPLLQLFGLVLEDIWKLQGKQGKITAYKQEIEKYRRKLEPEKFKDKVKKITDEAVEELLFSKHLRETNNQKTGNQAITSFFTKK
jgi:DNA polymerase elongation subunit (family B)